MIYFNQFKQFSYDERERMTIPRAEASRVLRDLSKATLASPRKFVDRATLIKILLDKPGLFSLQNILCAEETPEDTFNCAEADQVARALERGREDLVTIGLIISLMPRKAVQSEALPTDPLGLMPSPLIPMSEDGRVIAVLPGTATPPGASRSDPLTPQEAENLYRLANWIKETIARHNPMSRDTPLADALPLVLEHLRPRSLWLLMRRGHHIRERIPSLGHNCQPTSGGELSYAGQLHELYSELIMKNISRFFRYPTLFKRFQELFRDRLVALAKEKARARARGQSAPDQKIKVLDIGISTGEEPLTIALMAALALENQRKSLERILERDPGQISDWLEITCTEKEDEYAGDIRQLLAAGRYPRQFLEEIPSEYLAQFRRLGFIVEADDSFSFSQAIAATMTVNFLNFFEPGAIDNPFFLAQYDFVFYIKVMEYIMTDPQGLEQAQCGQKAALFFDSGRLLKPGGFFFTDPSQARETWSQQMMAAAAGSALYATLRRLPGGEALGAILGPPSTASNDPTAMLRAGELVAPIALPLLDPQAFVDAGFRYPADEVAIYRCTGRARTPREREIADLREQLQRTERDLAKLRKVIATGRLLFERQREALAVRQVGEGEVEDLRVRIRELEREVDE